MAATASGMRWRRATGKPSDASALPSPKNSSADSAAPPIDAGCVMPSLTAANTTLELKRAATHHIFAAVSNCP